MKKKRGEKMENWVIRTVTVSMNMPISELKIPSNWEPFWVERFGNEYRIWLKHFEEE